MGIFNMFGGGFDKKLEGGARHAKRPDHRCSHLRRIPVGPCAGAENVPLDRIAGFKAAADTPLFVYCQSGGRSAQAAHILEQNGFADVTNLGGIMSYRGPVEM